MKIGVYPGTFDPITNGHVDILVRSARVFDKVIVAVAPNPHKHPLFDLDERVQMAKLVIEGLARVEVKTFEGLLVDFLRREGAQAIIRGLRAISDFEYEFQIALLNRNLEPAIETVFFMPSDEYSYVTSSIIKELARLGGPLKDLVHPDVAKRLEQRLRRTGA